MDVHQKEFTQRLQSAVADSPELHKKLSAASSLEDAASLLSTALDSTVSAHDLQSISRNAQSQMTDEQLEAVAGGGEHLGIIVIMSVLTFGIGCGLASAINEAQSKGECAKSFNS